jgi:hypothetical protein
MPTISREAVNCNHPCDTPYVSTEGTLAGAFLSNAGLGRTAVS